MRKRAYNETPVQRIATVATAYRQPTGPNGRSTALAPPAGQNEEAGALSELPVDALQIISHYTAHRRLPLSGVPHDYVMDCPDYYAQRLLAALNFPATAGPALERALLRWARVASDLFDGADESTAAGY